MSPGIRRASIVLTALAGQTLCALTQTPQPTTPTPIALLTSAVHRLEAADKDVDRFTYFQKFRMVDIGRSGLMVHNSNRRYEITYINDLPYMRLLEIDDKPLTGKDLIAEHKRYDKAVAQKHELGSHKRAEADGYTMMKSDIDLDLLLTPEYVLTELPETTPDLHLIEATLPPKGKHKEKCPWHFKLWVSDKDPGTPFLTRYVANTTDEASDTCQKQGEEVRYTLVDNLPKFSFIAARMNIDDERDGGSRTIEYFSIYSDYRRFSSTVSILPEPPPEP